MSRRLLISALPGDLQAALLDGDRLIDFLVLRGARGPLPGDLYLAKVARLDEGLAAAFVDLGEARPALLDMAETAKPSEGASLAVRVLRAPAPGKGAKVTARLSEEERARAGAAQGKAPCRVSGGDPLAALLERHGPSEILVDDPDLLLELKAKRAPRWSQALAPYRGTRPLFEEAGVAEEIERLLEPEVPLPSGGTLLIEPVATLVAVDVNAGSHLGQGGAQARALAVDLEAAAEIARQLRLRALSGLIVIDFLGLERKSDRAKVTAALKAALEDDPARSQVEVLRASGLAELTRQRLGPALHELLTEPCPHCGNGRAKSAATLAFEALRAARAAGQAEPAAALVLEAPPAVLAALESGVAAAAARALCQRLGGRLSWRRWEGEGAVPHGFRLVAGRQAP